MSYRTLRALLDQMAGGSMGDVIAELHREGHIKDQHYIAVCRLLEDMRRCHGSSEGIVPQYAVRVQTSVRSRSQPPGGGDPDAFNRMDAVLATLRDHERELLAFLIKKREMARGSLSDLGRLLSAYKTNKTTRANAIGRIAGLAATIAEAEAYAP